ncbi:UNVERIFIED_CONTAM: hypothetical protein Sradi_6426600 [Sesamum radiatum]|uniref:Uncharacterized protein n=1 Tax=Sesamum radiatum TaxID=300843 RepID=A0AAW2K575_SESRA
MVELCQQVTKETMPISVVFPSASTTVEELPVHFRAPLHLPAYDGTTHSIEYTRKFENAALLHKCIDGVKCHVFSYYTNKFCPAMVRPTSSWIS